MNLNFLPVWFKSQLSLPNIYSVCTGFDNAAFCMYKHLFLLQLTDYTGLNATAVFLSDFHEVEGVLKVLTE